MAIEQDIYEHTKHITDNNMLLGRGLVQPCSPANSGSRKNMHSVHLAQMEPPINGELAMFSTGREAEFGKHSSSYITADTEYEVLYKVPKFAFKPSHHYYLIVKEVNTNKYHMFERLICRHTVEAHGYMCNNAYLDSCNPGTKIKQGKVVQTSKAFDGENRLNGVNLNTLYISTDRTKEDSYQLSESAAVALGVASINVLSVGINSNDVPKNRYGDDTVYKSFPDIGEDITDCRLMDTIRIENDNILYTLASNQLQSDSMSDRSILMDGKVVDIDVYCNDEEALKDNIYAQQINFYREQKSLLCNTIVELITPIILSGGELSRDLHRLYSKCRDVVDGKQYFKDKQFNNVIIDFTVIQRHDVEESDKIVNRYGGKGIVSKIIPDDEMPVLDNGLQVDVLCNQATCDNRQNLGQMHELSLNFIGNRFIDYFKETYKNGHFVQKAQMLHKLMLLVEPPYAKEYESWCNDEQTAKMLIDSILDYDAILFVAPPFTTIVNIDTIAKIYEEFPFIDMYTMYSPMLNSAGETRWVASRRKMVVANILYYRLIQTGFDKFSATGLSITNLRNLNTKSKEAKMHLSRNSRTPIMLGYMETGNLLHIGVRNVITHMMIYSVSPQARRLCEGLLVGDPYDINIRLDGNSKNRNAEIINTIFKTMGLRLEFTKTPKVKKTLCQQILVRPADYKEVLKPIPSEYNYILNNPRIAKIHRQAKIEAILSDPRSRTELKPLVTRLLCRPLQEGENPEDLTYIDDRRS